MKGNRLTTSGYRRSWLKLTVVEHKSQERRRPPWYCSVATADAGCQGSRWSATPETLFWSLNFVRILPQAGRRRKRRREPLHCIHRQVGRMVWHRVWGRGGGRLWRRRRHWVVRRRMRRRMARVGGRGGGQAAPSPHRHRLKPRTNKIKHESEIVE